MGVFSNEIKFSIFANMLFEGRLSQFYRYGKELLHDVLKVMGRFVNTDVQIQEVNQRSSFFQLYCLFVNKGFLKKS